MKCSNPSPRCSKSIFALLILVVSTAVADPDAGLVHSQEAGWPQFRGPARNGVSLESGLLTAWPDDGPELLWQVADLGESYSSPIITEHGIFVTGDVEDDLVISAFDLDGKLLWKKTNGSAWKGSYPGARASCTYDDGRLFHMNAHGRAVRLDPLTGDELWAVDIKERFDAQDTRWGLTESVMVDDDRIYVTPGGTKAFMAALDAHTGASVWVSDPLRYEKTYARGGRPLATPEAAADHAGYAPPILIEFEGRRLIARSAGHHVVCMDAETGSFLWIHPVYAANGVIGTTPVLWKNNLVFSAPDDFGTQMFRMQVDGDSIQFEKVWKAPLDNCHGGLVVFEDRIYGSGYRRMKDWACIDAVSGTILYSRKDFPQGSVLFADGHLYALSDNGLLSLLKPADDGFHIKGQFQIDVGRRNDVWAHPVIHDGRLYIRDMDRIWCYDIKSR